jgi:hypothetical protein
MRRLFMPIVIAAFAAGCGERAIMPTSPLTPGVASHDLGTPPPPPVGGDGRAELDVNDASDGSSATACGGSFTFPFTYDYFVNKNGYNAFLHFFVNGQGLDASIHQTANKIGGNGTFSGPGFSFTIATVTGTITNENNTRPNSVTVALTGQFSDGVTTCAANATLTADLVVVRDQ